jgi:hypothetical protein
MAIFNHLLETDSFLVLAFRSGFKCGQSGAVLLASGRVTIVTSVTTLWKGVLDLWSGYAPLLPCLWSEPKGVTLCAGDSGDDGGGRSSPQPSYPSCRISIRGHKM